jgi:hypothetical protein
MNFTSSIHFVQTNAQIINLERTAKVVMILWEGQCFLQTPKSGAIIPPCDIYNKKKTLELNLLHERSVFLNQNALGKLKDEELVEME